MAVREYYVFRNLDDPSEVVVASERELVAGTFEMVAGPYSSREIAEKHSVDEERDEEE